MTRRELGAALVAVVVASCHASGARTPWGESSGTVAAEHANVRTMNDGYRRTASHVLVRRIDVPTRAALDYAAYHANFMIADPPPETEMPADRAPATAHPFGGLLDEPSLTSDVTRTPLTADERRHPMALAPAIQYLEAHHVAGAARLQEVTAAVRGEAWGLPVTPGVALQTPAEAYLHAPASGPVELWVKIEFAPWLSAFKDLPDQDGDGFPELYGRVREDHAPKDALETLRADYSTRPLDAKEIKLWANELSSYWYPSFNTDLVPPGPRFPDEHTEADIVRELGGKSYEVPAVVLRGKPEGKATYEVFLIEGNPGAPAKASDAAPAKDALAPTRPTPDPAPLLQTIARELAANGGSWEKWSAELGPFRADVKKSLASAPRTVKAIPGSDGFLFFRTSLEYVIGGDLERQPAAKNPVPVILEFKKLLEAQGVDFLFVPVPTKVEIFPDELAPSQKALVGKVTNPYLRKFEKTLAEQGVEVVDLLGPLLEARKKGDGPGEEPLYQRQDTHWTDRGLRLAAELLAKRIQRYPWYAALAKRGRSFGVKETTFTRFGDLHSRLPEGKKRGYEPEKLVAHQVIGPDGAPYDDDADSPVVLLGDSFTGVYELTDAEHAGLSAHLAKGISYPLDLVMSYGGGPNVRQKLMRRGVSALAAKKLVIWVMTARDLYNYWEAWEPLGTK